MRSTRRILVAVTVVGFVLRLWWVLAAEHSDAFNDTYFYKSAAIFLHQGQGYIGFNGTPTAQWPPGYPTLLAGLIWFWGNRPIVFEVFNVLLGTATIPLLYLVARRHFGVRVGLVTAGLFAVMPGPILWTELTLTETLYTFLFVLFLLLLSVARPTWWWAAGVGVYIGAVALVRSEAVVWGILPLVLWWRAAGWKAALPRMGLVAATFLLVLTPWTVRNHRAMGEFVLLSTNNGSTLWAGHHPGATGMESYPSQELVNSLLRDGVPTEVAISEGLQRLAWEHIREHPLETLELVPKKVIMLMRGDSGAMSWVNAGPTPAVNAATTVYVSVAADGAWFSLLLLTVVGVFALGRRTWRDPLMTAIATTFVVLLVLYGVVYYGNYRYRMPYEPAMMIVAALVIVRGAAGLRAARLALAAEPEPEPADADGADPAAGDGTADPDEANGSAPSDAVTDEPAVSPDESPDAEEPETRTPG